MMATLMMEYRQRHKKDFILICQAGLVFLNKEGLILKGAKYTKEETPAAIITTNLQGQATSTCKNCCRSYPGVVVESFVPQQGEPFFVQLGHAHVAPDMDLRKTLKLFEGRHFPSDLVPYLAKKPRDLELWLWKWFINSNEIEQNPVWQSRSSKRPQGNVLEEMAWCAMRMPSLYAVYYNLCQTFLPGRKYILYT